MSVPWVIILLQGLQLYGHCFFWAKASVRHHLLPNPHQEGSAASLGLRLYDLTTKAASHFTAQAWCTALFTPASGVWYMSLSFWGRYRFTSGSGTF